MSKETMDKKKKDDEEEIPKSTQSSLKQMLVQEGSMYSMRQGSRRSVSTQRSVNSVGSVISNGTRRSIKSDDITPRVTNRTIKTIGTKGLEASKLRSIFLDDQRKTAKMTTGEPKKHRKVKKKKNPRDLDSDDQTLSADDHTVGESSIGTESYDQLSDEELTDSSSITSKKKSKKHKKKPPRHSITNTRSEDHSDDNTEVENNDDDDITEASSLMSKNKSRKMSRANDNTQEGEHTDTDDDTVGESDGRSRLGDANLGLLLPALPDFDRKMVRTIDIEGDDRPNTTKRKISIVKHSSLTATEDQDIGHGIGELNIPVLISDDRLSQHDNDMKIQAIAVNDNNDDTWPEEEKQVLANTADQVDENEGHSSDFHHHLFDLVSKNEDQFKVFLEAMLPGRDLSNFHEFCDTVADAVTEKSTRRNGGQAMQDDDVVPELPNLSKGAEGSPNSPMLPSLIDDELDSLASTKSSKGLSSRGLMMNRQGSTLRMENFHRRSLIRQEATRRRSRMATIISHRPQNGGSISDADYYSFFEEHIAELERLLDDQENEIDQLDRMIMKYKKHIHELTDEFEAKKRSTVYLEDKCTLLKAELSKAISRADNLQFKISETDADRDLKYLEVSHERDELTKELNSLRKENSEIRFAFAEIQETLGPKDDRLPLLMGEMDVLKYNIIQAGKETGVPERKMSFGSDADFDLNMSVPSTSKSKRRSLKEGMGGSERRLSSGGSESRERRLSMTSPSRGIGRTVSERIHMPAPSFNLPDPRHHSAGIEKLPAYKSKSQPVKKNPTPPVSLTPQTVAGHAWEEEVARTMYKIKTDNMHSHIGRDQDIFSSYMNGRPVNILQPPTLSVPEGSLVRTDPSLASFPTAQKDNTLTTSPRVMIDLNAAAMHAETLAESVAASSEASSGGKKKKKKDKDKSERKERKRDKKEQRHRSDQSVVGVDAD